MENIINGYKNVPYFNNKTTGRRGALAVHGGKGSPEQIQDELKEITFREKLDIKSLSDDQIKKLLVYNNIGVDCSGFAFYLLNNLSLTKGKGALGKNLKFNSFLGKFFRQVQNAGVKLFADNRNSHVISMDEVSVGDIITMIGNEDGVMRDHILIVTEVSPSTIFYTHSVAWPTDGEYGSGIHKGKIEIINPEKTIAEQNWIELDKTGEENYTHSRAKKSVTELRRLNWF